MSNVIIVHVKSTFKCALDPICIQYGIRYWHNQLPADIAGWLYNQPIYMNYIVEWYG